MQQLEHHKGAFQLSLPLTRLCRRAVLWALGIPTGVIYALYFLEWAHILYFLGYTLRRYCCLVLYVVLLQLRSGCVTGGPLESLGTTWRVCESVALGVYKTLRVGCDIIL